MKKAYDLAIIGGGAAGSTAAEKANKEGHSVALIERDHLGGTCLNYGCDPTKALLHTAELLYRTKQAQERGLCEVKIGVDWTAVQKHVQGIVAEIRGGAPATAQKTMRERGIDLFMCEGTFQDEHHLDVEGQTIQAENILIATGAQSIIPHVPGLAEAGYITNKEAVYLDALPQSLAVVGGGPIGVEFAQIFNRFGVEVHIIEAQEHLLPHDDPELTQILAEILADEGIQLHLQAKLLSVATQPSGKELTVQYANEYEQPIVVEEILIAVGRKPSLASLQPDAAGVKLDEDGWVKVDKNLRTNVPHIWAAGDVWPGLKFTHVAARQGKLAVHNMFSDKPEPFSATWIPWVTYTDPALAHVGASEAELQAKGVSYRCGRFPLDEVPKALVTGQTKGLIKLLIGSKDRILGASILATNAGELLSPLLVAANSNLPISALAETIYPYPTWAAGIGYAVREVEPI